MKMYLYFKEGLYFVSVKYLTAWKILIKLKLYFGFYFSRALYGYEGQSNDLNLISKGCKYKKC